MREFTYRGLRIRGSTAPAVIDASGRAAARRNERTTFDIAPVVTSFRAVKPHSGSQRQSNTTSKPIYGFEDKIHSRKIHALDRKVHPNPTERRNSLPCTTRHISITKGLGRKEESPSRRCLYLSPEEVLLVIKQKLATGYSGIKQYFEENQTANQGLCRKQICHSLFLMCGLLDDMQVEAILEMLGLGNCEYISFTAFIEPFLKDERVNRNWNKSVERKTWMEEKFKLPVQLLPSHTRCPVDMFQVVEYHDSKAAQRMLKNKLVERPEEVLPLFPVSCFAVNGVVLKQHLSDAVKTLGIKMYKDEFERLWLSFGVGNTIASPCQRFCDCLGVSYTKMSKLRQELVDASEMKQGAAHPFPDGQVQRPSSVVSVVLDTGSLSRCRTAATRRTSLGGSDEEPTPINPTLNVNQIFLKSSRPLSSTVLAKVAKQLKGKLKELRRSFRREDAQNTRRINANRFREGLTGAGVVLSQDELFYLFSRYDPSLKNSIPYEKFVKDCVECNQSY